MAKKTKIQMKNIEKFSKRMDEICDAGIAGKPTTAEHLYSKLNKKFKQEPKQKPIEEYDVEYTDFDSADILMEQIVSHNQAKLNKENECEPNPDFKQERIEILSEALENVSQVVSLVNMSSVLYGGAFVEVQGRPLSATRHVFTSKPV